MLYLSCLVIFHIDLYKPSTCILQKMFCPLLLQYRNLNMPSLGTKSIANCKIRRELYNSWALARGKKLFLAVGKLWPQDNWENCVECRIFY